MTTLSKKRHRFQRLEERVDALSTDLRLHTKTNATDISLTFLEELMLQAELTTIEEFQVMFRKIQPLVTTTPQLLHHLQKVVAVLDSELKCEKSDVYTQRIVAVLKLLTALARELRKEFYPYFEVVLPSIVAVVDSKNPELSAQVFKTLTMLFNCLRSQILKDMQSIHKFYFPLLGHPKQFVREFACQTLSVLLRRIDNVKELRLYLKAYLKALVHGSGIDNICLRDGTARLFFAMIRNVNHGFHSRMKELFTYLLTVFGPHIVAGEDVGALEALFDIIRSTTEQLIKHTNAAYVSNLLECFVAVSNKVLVTRSNNSSKQHNTTQTDEYISRILQLLIKFVSYKRGGLLDQCNFEVICKVICRIVSENFVQDGHASMSLNKTIVQFLQVSSLWFPHEPLVKKLTNQVFELFRKEEKDFWISELLKFSGKSLETGDLEYVTKVLSPVILHVAVGELLDLDVAAFSLMICRLGKYMTEHDMFSNDNPIVVFDEGIKLLYHSSVEIGSLTKKLLAVSNRICKPLLLKDTPLDDLALACTFFQAIAFLKLDTTALQPFVESIGKQISKSHIEGNSKLSAAWMALDAQLWRLVQICKNNEVTNRTELSSFVIDALEGAHSSHAKLSVMLEFLLLKTADERQKLLPLSILPIMYKLLERNLSAQSHALRKVSLEILGCFEPLSFHNSEDCTLDGTCDMVQLCLSLENHCDNVGLEVEREMIRLLGRVTVLCRSVQTPVIYKKIAVSHLLGLYHVKFATLWPHIADSVAAAMCSDFNETWSIMANELLSTSSRDPSATISSDENYTCESNNSMEDVQGTFITLCNLEMGLVDSNEVTDAITHHNLIWRGMQKFVSHVETKTKFLVPLFFRFLLDQYTIIYLDDFEEPKLQQMKAACEKVSTRDLHYRRVFSDLTSKAIRSKLIDFLNLFAEFKNMKGAYENRLLHEIFFALLLKSDDIILKLALRCLYTFGNKHLNTYKEKLNRIVDPATFRDELTNFDISQEGGLVLSEHRQGLLSVLMRILYSKCISKKGRNSGDTSAARRAVILAYLSYLESTELVLFVQLVTRAFCTKITIDEEHLRDQFSLVPIERVSASKILGFLNLLEELIAQLGVKLTVFVPVIADLVVSFLQVKQVAGSGVNLLEEAHPDDAKGAVTPASSQKLIRSLIYRRLAELVDVYDSTVNLRNWIEHAVIFADDSLTHLPKVVIGAEKSPALLNFLLSIASADRGRHALTPPNIEHVISCLSSGLDTHQATPNMQVPRGILPDILSVVIQFIDSLLEGDEINNTSIVIPFVPLILDQFILRFQSKAARFAAEKYAGSLKREMFLLCRLSNHVITSAVSSRCSQDLFQLLLPFLLRNHRCTASEIENTLEVLTNLVPLLPEPQKHVLWLSKLLVPGANCLNDRGPRQRLISLFLALGAHEKLASIHEVAGTLADLNAYDPQKIEEIDFDRRMRTLDRINETGFKAFCDEPIKLAPILSEYLHSMHLSEFSVRSAASMGVQKFIELCSTGLQKQTSHSVTLLSVLESIVMPCIRASLKSPVEEVRRGFVNLLSAIADATALHVEPYVHGDLARLRNVSDPESDFFYNVCHIQLHRRRRALQRLGSLISEMVRESTSNEVVIFSNSTVNNIIIPLIMHFIFECTSKAKQSLGNEAATCLGSASSLLGWSNYFSLLRLLLKSIEGHVESEGVIIAAICSVVDNFHFETPDTAENWVKSDVARNSENYLKQPSKVQMSMEQQVLPLIKQYLFRDGSNKSKSSHQASMSFEEDRINVKENVCSIRVPLALAVVKVLRRLRAQTFYIEFPKLLLSFAKLLRSKEESIRVSARTTLVKISIELGPKYLLPIVEELRHTLRDGYMVHVLSYTLHSVLEKIDTMIEPKKPVSLLQGSICSEDYSSPLDECIPAIMHIIAEDMFSGVVESQDGSEFKSKMKEAKSSRSYDSLELLAKSLSFYPNESIHAVVTPIVQKYQVHENTKALLVLREGLRRIALGLSKNPSVEPSYGFLYIHSILSISLDRIRPETDVEKEKYLESSSTVCSWLICDKAGTSSKTGLLEKKVSAYETARVEISGRRTGFDRNSEQMKESGSLAHLEELMNFAVFMAYTLIRSGAVSPELVDPLVPNLLRCTGEVRHDKVVVNSIKCLSTFLNHNIPSMEIALTSFVDRVFKIIQKAGSSTGNEMVQTCYRALTITLQRRPEYRLSEPQLRVLLGFLRADLEQMDHQNATYALLKSVVASKLVIPEVYDVMVRVGELILQSDAESARSNCSSIFINFLLEYPLGYKRLSHHLNFLMNNLSYIHESGRKGVLECLSVLVKKFPQNLLNERAQFFFLPLVLRVANDESAECRGLASEVIRTLLGRLGNQELNECVLLFSKWWNPTGSERKLQCIAAQITGLLLELRPEFLEKVAMAILEHALNIIDAQLSILHEGEEDKSIDWMLLYHCINCCVKFNIHLVGPFEQWLNVSGMLERIQKLTQHPHPWVRLASIRLLSSYLSRRDPTTLKFNTQIKRLNGKLSGDEYLKKDGKLFMLASTVCNSIQKQLNDDITKEVLVVLPFLCTALYKNSKIRQNLKEEVNDIAELEDLSLDKNSALGWVFSRLSYAARDSDEKLQVTVYNVFAAVAATHDASMWESYLVHMINPLYRSASARKEEEENNEGAILAQEVLEFLEKKSGSSVFLEAYSHVQKRLSAFRATRKEKRKQDAINNPEDFAKRKIRKNEQKRVSKQLKKRKYALMKGTIPNRPQKMRRPGVEE